MSDLFNQVPPAPTQAAVLSVSQLNREVAEHLESRFPMMWVGGEVSNFVAASSGHWYFTLKDAGASVRGVMFRGRASQVGFTPRNGDQIEVRARVTLYEPRGDYQLQIIGMRRGGQGALFEQFLQLRARLEAAGLFAPERKRPLAPWPRALGVITSLRAAALRDVLTALARRAPHIPVVVYPAAVQGAEAPAQLVAALNAAVRHGVADTLLLVRGGGSLEDLWGFNNEALAHAIAASPLPVVSGVGHETDFTIADFVADLRAPTPTAAAELACWPREQWQGRLEQLTDALQARQQRRLERLMQRVDRAGTRLVSPAARLARQQDRLDHVRLRLQQALRRRQEQQTHRLAALQRQLAMLGPGQRLARQQLALAQVTMRLRQAMLRRQEREAQRLATLGRQLTVLGPSQTLARGYSIVRGADGQILHQSAGLVAGDRLQIDFAQGRAEAEVLTVAPGANGLAPLVPAGTPK